MPKPTHYIGIDLGGTNVQAALVDPAGKILARDKTKTKAHQGTDKVLEAIAKVVAKVQKEAEIDKPSVGGIGLGAPGAVDVDKGVVLEAVNLGWNDFPLAETLKKRLDLPIVVDNDVNVGAWGEFQAGAARDHTDMLAIFVGTGIGGGLVLGGQLHRGALLTAGEIGHTVIQAEAPIGGRTLENLAGRNSLVNRLTGLIESNHPSKLTDIVEGDYTKIRSKALAKAYDAEDELTVEVIEMAARYVGIAAANAVTLLSLPCVVIGGGVAEAIGKPFIRMVRTSFRKHVFPPSLTKCKIAPSTLEDDAGPLGAALLARGRIDQAD